MVGLELWGGSIQSLERSQGWISAGKRRNNTCTHTCRGTHTPSSTDLPISVPALTFTEPLREIKGLRDSLSHKNLLQEWQAAAEMSRDWKLGCSSGYSRGSCCFLAAFVSLPGFSSPKLTGLMPRFSAVIEQVPLLLLWKQPGSIFLLVESMAEPWNRVKKSSMRSWRNPMPSWFKEISGFWSWPLQIKYCPGKDSVMLCWLCSRKFPVDAFWVTVRTFGNPVF